jgi:hypothetical protein
VDTDTQQLKALLQREADQIKREALQSGGNVTAERLETVTRLERLVEIEDRLATPPSRNYWVLPALLVLTLTVATALFFTHVPRTEIELNTNLTAFSFRTIEKDALLLANTRLLGVTFAGARKIEIRRSGEWPGIDKDATNAAGPFEISPGSGSGSITLNAITVPAQTRVWIKLGPDPGRLKLTLEGDALDIVVSLGGSLQLTQQGETVAVDILRASRAVFSSGTNAIDLDITFAQTDTVQFSPQIAVDSLLFEHVRRFEGVDLPVSSVISGEVYLAALNGRKSDLRAGQKLSLKNIKEGRIRQIRTEPGFAALQFQGTVKEIKTGSVDNPRNLMPTVLEWLQARHGLSLVWGSALYIFGFVSTALRWSKVKV